MKNLKAVLISTVVITQLWAKPVLLDGGPSKVPPRAVDLQNPDFSRIKGTLTTRQSDKIEIIEFGEKTGTYATAMIFHGASLPQGLGAELKGLHIIQIVFGTKEKTSDKLPRFGAASLLIRKIPTKPVTLRSILPDGPDQLENLALLMFTSPSAPKERGDEDRLKGNFFSRAGTVQLTPVGMVENIVVNHQDNKLKFKSQTFKIVFNSELGTPFNEQGFGLSGTIETPVIWPNGAEAEAYIKETASLTLTGPTVLPFLHQEGIQHHKRDIAGSTKKDKK